MKTTKIKLFAISMFFLLCIIMPSGCSHNYENDLVIQEKNYSPITLEAEDQQLTGNLHVSNSRSGYSGTGYVDGFQNDDDYITFTVVIENDDFYDLDFKTGADDHKVNLVFLDGDNVGELTTDSKTFTSSVLRRVFMNAGSHSIQVKKSWGWIYLDNLTIAQSEPLPDDLYDIEVKLSNPNATESTKRLMSYLADIYGSRILTGQYCDTGMIGTECSSIYNVTGRYPAVVGFDFMNYSPAAVEHGVNGNSTIFAKAYAQKGGIVTFCWHWTLPDRYVSSGGNWYSSFYTSSTNFKLDKVLDGSDPDGYSALMDGIDAIAQQILILQDNDVPILWRPLHEASGGWFWWGAAGAEAYKELYILLYDKLTNEYGCNNLIWIWNGQDKEWYPGDEYVDIIGTDIYPGEHVYTSQFDKFLECVETGGKHKLTVLSENGCVIDPELAVRDGAMWGFFATWGGEFVLKSSKFAAYSDRYTEEDMLKKAYSSEYMITRDELPDLKAYPIREEFTK